MMLLLMSTTIMMIVIKTMMIMPATTTMITVAMTAAMTTITSTRRVVTSLHQITEVMQRGAQLVLRWVTGCPVMLPADLKPKVDILLFATNAYEIYHFPNAKILAFNIMIAKHQLTLFKYTASLYSRPWAGN